MGFEFQGLGSRVGFKVSGLGRRLMGLGFGGGWVLRFRLRASGSVPAENTCY